MPCKEEIEPKGRAADIQQIYMGNILINETHSSKTFKLVFIYKLYLYFVLGDC